MERSHAELSEARVTATEIAWGVAACAERTGDLPPTSRKVPASIRFVHSTAYQSRASDWEDPAFACEGFHMFGPQAFQYQWQRADDGLGGVVHALSEDDRSDHTVRLQVRCSRDGTSLRCRPDAMPIEPPPPTFGEAWWTSYRGTKAQW